MKNHLFFFVFFFIAISNLQTPEGFQIKTLKIYDENGEDIHLKLIKE